MNIIENQNYINKDITNKIIPLYDKYRAAETDVDKAKFVKAILDVAQDTNNEYYRKIEENRQILNKFNNK